MKKQLLFLLLSALGTYSHGQISTVDSLFYENLKNQWELVGQTDTGLVNLNLNYSQTNFVGCPETRSNIKTNKQTISFNYPEGSELFNIEFDETLPSLSLKDTSTIEIASMFKKLAEANLCSGIMQFNICRNSRETDDWIYYFMLEELSKKAYSDENSQKIFTWFILLRSGYDVRLGISGNKLVLLLPIDIQKLNSQDNIYIYKNKYYLVSETIENELKCYAVQHDFAHASFSLSLITKNASEKKYGKNTPEFLRAEINSTVYDSLSNASSSFYRGTIAPINELNNLAVGVNDRIFCSGYFTDSCAVEDKTYKTKYRNQYASIIAAYENGKYIWIKHISEDGNNIPLAIRELKDEIIVLGVASGTFEDRILDEPAVFIGKINKNSGQPVKFFLLEKYNSILKNLSQDYAITFILDIDDSLTFHQTQVKKELYQSELFINRNDDVVFTISHEFTPGINQYKLDTWSPLYLLASSPETISENEFKKKIISSLYSENNILLEKKCDKGIAGLLAAIEICLTYKEFQGVDAKSAFDSYNPSFKSACKNIYDAIGKLTMKMNNMGQLVAYTSQGADVIFKNSKNEEVMRVENGAIISALKNVTGDYAIKVQKGLTVKGNHKVKGIYLEFKTGDMVFDLPYIPKRMSTININDDILESE